MNIKTTRFGEIEINDDKIIEFEQGIPGFDEEKQFVIIPYDEKSPFLFMQSVKQEDLAFLIINPFLIFADYEFEIDDASIEDLTVKQSEDLLIYTIITMNEGDIKKMTTNLVAPIVINKENNKAKQVVLEKSKYNTKHKLFEQRNAMLVLSRKIGQQIMIGQDITIKIVDVQGENVRIAIEAPKEIKIYRGEIYKAIVEENKQAINNVAAVDLSNITFK